MVRDSKEPAGRTEQFFGFDERVILAFEYFLGNRAFGLVEIREPIFTGPGYVVNYRLIRIGMQDYPTVIAPLGHIRMEGYAAHIYARDAYGAQYALSQGGPFRTLGRTVTKIRKFRRGIRIFRVPNPSSARKFVSCNTKSLLHSVLNGHEREKQFGIDIFSDAFGEFSIPYLENVLSGSVKSIQIFSFCKSRKRVVIQFQIRRKHRRKYRPSDGQDVAIAQFSPDSPVEMGKRMGLRRLVDRVHRGGSQEIASMLPRIFRPVKKLTGSGHAIIIEPLEIDHRFRHEIFLLSLLEKTPRVQNSHFDEGFYVFRSELFLREILLVFHVMLPLLETGVLAGLGILVADINRKGLFLAF
jgi:hypothetical protein